MEAINENSTHDPFYEIKNRIYALSTGFFFTPFSEAYGYGIIDKILPKITSTPYDIYISQIEVLIEDIDELEGDEERIRQSVRSEENSFVYRTEVDFELIVADVKKELAFYRMQLQKISKELWDRQQKYTVQSSIKPYRTSLSRAQLAYLFKALVEKNIIEVQKGQATTFIKRISEIFSSKGKIEANSHKKLYDDYVSIDFEAKKSWAQLFKELREHSEQNI